MTIIYKIKVENKKKLFINEMKSIPINEYINRKCNRFRIAAK